MASREPACWQRDLAILRRAVLVPVSYCTSAGTLALFTGSVVGILRRRPLLFFFLFSPLISEGYVAIGGALRGQVRGTASMIATFIFLGVQSSLILFLVYRSRGARLAAAALALFCTSYALFACFVGAMALADDWL